MIRLWSVLLFALVINAAAMTPVPLTCIFSIKEGTEYTLSPMESSSNPYESALSCVACVYSRMGETEIKQCQSERCGGESNTDPVHATGHVWHSTRDGLPSKVYCCETDRCNDDVPVSCYKSKDGSDANEEHFDDFENRLCHACIFLRNADDHAETWQNCVADKCGGSSSHGMLPALGELKRKTYERNGVMITIEGTCCQKDFCNDSFPEIFE